MDDVEKLIKQLEQDNKYSYVNPKTQKEQIIIVKSKFMAIVDFIEVITLTLSLSTIAILGLLIML